MTVTQSVFAEENPSKPMMACATFSLIRRCGPPPSATAAVVMAVLTDYFRRHVMAKNDIRQTASTLEFQKPADHPLIRRGVLRANTGQEHHMLASYKIRHVAGTGEDLSCLQQLEDESAAMYFNIVHGTRLRRRFTTQAAGNQCPDYVLVAEENFDAAGRASEREIPLFEIAP